MDHVQTSAAGSTPAALRLAQLRCTCCQATLYSFPLPILWGNAPAFVQCAVCFARLEVRPLRSGEHMLTAVSPSSHREAVREDLEAQRQVLSRPPGAAPAAGSQRSAPIPAWHAVRLEPTTFANLGLRLDDLNVIVEIVPDSAAGRVPVGRLRVGERVWSVDGAPLDFDGDSLETVVEWDKGAEHHLLCAPAGEAPADAAPPELGLPAEVGGVHPFDPVDRQVMELLLNRTVDWWGPVLSSINAALANEPGVEGEDGEDGEDTGTETLLQTLVWLPPDKHIGENLTRLSLAVAIPKINNFGGVIGQHYAIVRRGAAEMLAFRLPALAGHAQQRATTGYKGQWSSQREAEMEGAKFKLELRAFAERQYYERCVPLQAAAGAAMLSERGWLQASPPVVAGGVAGSGPARVVGSKRPLGALDRPALPPDLNPLELQMVATPPDVEKGESSYEAVPIGRRAAAEANQALAQAKTGTDAHFFTGKELRGYHGQRHPQATTASASVDKEEGGEEEDEMKQ